jgi:L-alanine-DL-glutamate epimerase-like enolase superfamily enzyme
LPGQPTIVSADLYAVSLPYAEAKTWTIGGVETESHYVVLRLTDSAGRTGAAEVVCKPAWNGMEQPVLLAAFEHLAWPLLRGQEAVGEAQGASLCKGMAGSLAPLSLADNAWRDLVTPWDDGQRGARVPGAKVLNRDAPAKMADEARKAVLDQGYPCLKIKIGQGLAIDDAVLTSITKAIRDAAVLTVDANSAYRADEVAKLDRVMADHGVTFLEDPCPLMPDLSAEEVIRGCSLPVVVDRNASSLGMAKAFADRGATYFSAKPSRIGPAEAGVVAGLAADLGGGICFGTYAEGPLGVLNQLVFVAHFAVEPVFLSAELDFHRELLGDYLLEPVRFEDGCFSLPAKGNAAAQVDWDKVASMAKAHVILGR